MVLTKDEILSAEDLKREEVDVPEWGGAVFVRMLTGRERDNLEAFWLRSKEAGSYANARATLVALTVCDESGARLFSDADIEALGGKSAAALDRLSDVAQRINRLTKKDLEDLAGNSSSGLPAASISA